MFNRKKKKKKIRKEHRTIRRGRGGENASVMNAIQKL